MSLLNVILFLFLKKTEYFPEYVKNILKCLVLMRSVMLPQREVILSLLVKVREGRCSAGHCDGRHNLSNNLVLLIIFHNHRG